MHQQQGYSLLEILIVIAIIGIIASFALPQYQQYQTKKQLLNAQTSLQNTLTLIKQTELYEPQLIQQLNNQTLTAIANGQAINCSSCPQTQTTPPSEVLTHYTLGGRVADGNYYLYALAQQDNQPSVLINQFAQSQICPSPDAVIAYINGNTQACEHKSTSN